MARLTMSGDKGFTYPAALLLIVVVSSAFLAASQQWSTIMKREKEKELLFRGSQIYYAIKSFYTQAPGGRNIYPKRIEDLIKDNRSAVSMRHLRQYYQDPMMPESGWGMVYDASGRIKGVYSKSREKPLKQKGFDAPFQSFDFKNTYQGWRFVYEPLKEAGS